MKNTLFAEKKIKLKNKWHFAENITEVMQNVLKSSKYGCCLTTSNGFLGVFSMCAHVCEGGL
jgi:hypothetical protein